MLLSYRIFQKNSKPDHKIKGIITFVLIYLQLIVAFSVRNNTISFTYDRTREVYSISI